MDEKSSGLELLNESFLGGKNNLYSEGLCKALYWSRAEFFCGSSGMKMRKPLSVMLAKVHI